MNRDIEYKIYNLFNYLNNIKSYSKIKNEIDLIKTSAMFPAGTDDSGNPSYGLTDISNKLISKVNNKSFTYFDFDLYVEDCIGDSAIEEGFAEYEEKHDSLDEFIGNCFYEELVNKKLYKKLPGIIKDKSVIRKDKLIENINKNIDALPKEIRSKFLKINKVIEDSKNPLFLFLYDTNQDSVDLTWKFVLHDIVHVIKDHRIEDIKDPNLFTTKSGDVIDLEEEAKEREEELLVAGNHHYHDSFSSYQIFKRVIENPINKYVHDRFLFSNLFKDFQKKILASTAALRSLEDATAPQNASPESGPEAYNLYNELIKDKDKILTKIRKDILFEILKECIIDTQNGKR